MAFKPIHKTALAGHIWPVIDRLIITSEKAKKIASNVTTIIEWTDIILIILIGWFMVPLVQIPYNVLFGGVGSSSRDEEATSKVLRPSKSTSTVAEQKQKEHPPISTKKSFRDTRYCIVLVHIAQAAQIALLVYFVDILDIILQSAGFNTTTILPIMGIDNFDLPRTFAKVVYTLWFGRVSRTFKRYLLLKYIGDKQQKFGLAELIDHIVDAVIMVIVALSIADILDVDNGMGFKSAFAFGSAGTLAFTLASQTVVSQIVNGFVLSASNRFYVGDIVKFGDASISGTVVQMGWFDTVLRGSDEVMMAVPNSTLAGQRVSNLSRHQRCQVTQNLRFHYTDIEKLKDLLEDIKSEIKDACPALVSDGTRPFRVVWTDYNDNYLHVLVDCHFTLKPIGDEYWNNRQAVLMAIHRAVKKHGIEFALLKYCCGGGASK